MTSFYKADSFDDLKIMQINEINGKYKIEMLKVIINDPDVGVLSVVAILIATAQTGLSRFCWFYNSRAVPEVC